MRNFGRVAEVMTANMSFTNNEFGVEFTVPFDNTPLPNESEIKIWNLSDSTISRIIRNETLVMNAGYEGDVGVILHGFISKVLTKREGIDRITYIYVLDSEDLSSRKTKDIAYAPGTLASYILRDMSSVLGLPIAQFELNQDFRYEEGYTANGEVTETIKKVAADCGTSAYVNKGKLYIRNLRIGGDAVFNLSSETGLIGSPEYFEDENFKGLNMKSQLQYRITTASVIQLNSKQYNGTFHIRKGVHKCSGSDFITEMEGIFP
ncbi:hypothetical protein HQN90_17835 [Paenibacillus alba]|uniref:phage protein n=1 Tax=Paenibacillus alba TaxID=1197127 RepID=UPI001564CAA6|nr:hypothetical protein [Paenibacillus alba]NQX67986.1 hypothetical protein [Paenibacillus alba]